MVAERRPTATLDSGDRGRRALAPNELPSRGWVEIAWRVFKGVQEDRVFLIAAGVTFYGLLALFPALRWNTKLLRIRPKAEIAPSGNAGRPWPTRLLRRCADVRGPFEARRSWHGDAPC
jgi:hypothetical protein